MNHGVYRIKSGSGEWQKFEYPIELQSTSLPWGGLRWWFTCPLILGDDACGRRVAKLYLPPGQRFFGCRHCYNLTYSSQQEGVADRLMRKARKIRARLGASNSFMEPILFKPKNMHQKTFDRLRREADRASNLSMMIMAHRLGINI